MFTLFSFTCKDFFNVKAITHSCKKVDKTAVKIYMFAKFFNVK